VECLEEDFEASRWVPPSVAKVRDRGDTTQAPSDLQALEYKEREIIGGGNRSFFRTTIQDISSVGRGVALYFYFTKTTIILLTLVSILSLPSMLFCYQGLKVRLLHSATHDLSNAIDSIGEQRFARIVQVYHRKHRIRLVREQGKSSASSHVLL
jgi:hypothetical protein